MDHNTVDLANYSQKGFLITTILLLLNTFNTFNEVIALLVHLCTISGFIIMVVLNYPKTIKNIDVIVNHIKSIFKKKSKDKIDNSTNVEEEV